VELVAEPGTFLASEAGHIPVDGLVFKSHEQREHAEDWQAALERSGSRVLPPNTAIELSAEGLWISRWVPLPAGSSVEARDAYRR
jgi:hypothetical protein